jgi:sialic acid synthase SpsE
MVTTKRPGNGLAPGELPKIIGRLTSRPIVADTMLTWEDLQ